MNFNQAIRRILQVAPAKGAILHLPPSNGLPARVCTKLEETWVACLYDFLGSMPLPACQFEVPALKGFKAMSYFEVKNSVPHGLHSEGGTFHPCLPFNTQLLRPQPFPLDRLLPGCDLGALVTLTANAVSDELRPEFAYIDVRGSYAVAGDEQQCGIVGGMDSKLDALLPTDLFRKWPSGPVSYFLDQHVLYVRVGDELRVARCRPRGDWVFPVGIHAWTAGACTVPTKALLQAFKGATKMADRRAVCVGASLGRPWIRIADQLHWLAEKETQEGPHAAQRIVDGNHLLGVLRGISAPTVDLHWSPVERDPFCMVAGSIRQYIWPMEWLPE